MGGNDNMYTIFRRGLPLLMALLALSLGFVAGPAAADSQPRLVQLGSNAAPEGLAPSPWSPDAPVELVIDDGSAENSIGLSAGGQFVWMNVFTPDPADFPFQLSVVSVVWPDTMAEGDQVQIVVWEDTDGDGDPSNADYLYSEDAVVMNNDFTTWNDYELAAPVMLTGPGDVVIGLVNRSGGAGYLDYPAAIDQDDPQLRSWLGAYSGDPPDPPTLPADNLWGRIDDFGFPGNWMIRGAGYTEDPLAVSVTDLSAESGLPVSPWAVLALAALLAAGSMTLALRLGRRAR
jgi:hypothetical protein